MSNVSKTTAGLRVAVRLALCLLAPAASGAHLECDSLAIFPPYPKVDFDRDIQPIFNRACVSCHQPGAEGFSGHALDLRPEQSYRDLVNVRSALDPSLILVNPFKPDPHDGSLLWRKVLCNKPVVGERMPPPPAAPLGSDLVKIFAWIFRGAPPGLEGTGRSYAIEPDLSGSWFDPSVPGQGFSFEVVESNPPKFAAYWATFSQDYVQIAQGDAARSLEQRWLLGVGQYASGDAGVTLDVQRYVGGLFDQPAVRASGTSIGFAELSFQSCSEATLRYDIKLDNDEAQRVQQTIVLRRLTPRASCASSKRD